MTPLDSRYTQVGFNLISVQVCPESALLIPDFFENPAKFVMCEVACLAVGGQGPVEEGDLADATPVPVAEGLGGRVAPSQPRALGQDQLQLGGGAARDQRPDQGQCILVEVRLEGVKNGEILAIQANV